MRMPPRKPSPPPPLQALRRAGAGAVRSATCLRLLFCLSVPLVGFAWLLDRTHQHERTAHAAFVRCRAEQASVEAAVLRTRAEDQAFWEARVRTADYVLWEVHEIDLRARNDDLRQLCTDVSVHSVTWSNTELMGYGSFVDGHNRRQLTCRWLHPRTP